MKNLLQWQKRYTTEISLFLNMLFVLYAATFIVNSGLERLSIYLATIVWLAEGDLKKKFRQIIRQKIILYYFGIILIFMLSVFFSDSSVNGFIQEKYSSGYSYFLHKSVVYFLMAVYLSTSLRHTFVKYLLYAFMLQSFYMVGHIFYLYLSSYAQGNDFTYFILSTNRIFYSIALNVALMLLASFYTKHTGIFQKGVLAAAALSIVIAILLLGGRAGIFALLVNIAWMLWYISKHYLKAVQTLSLFAGVFLLLLGSYFVIPQVKHRIDLAVSDINMARVSGNFHTPLGIRFGLYEASIGLLTQNPCTFVCGLGAGDAREKLRQYVTQKRPDRVFIAKERHVHNHYLQTWIDGGVPALLLYMALLLSLFRLRVPERFTVPLYGFLVSFLILGISDIFYHRGAILGLFAFGTGLFLSISNHYVQNREENKR